MSQFFSRASARAPRPTNPLFRREMRERWRRPLTLLQLLLFASALAWIGYNIYYTTVPLGASLAPDSLRGVGRGFFFALAQWHAMAWIPGGLLLAAPTLAAERERGHLTEWVLAGLSPSSIVSAKFRALAGFVLVMVCVPFPIFALCFPLGGVSPLDFLAIFAFTVAIALNSVGLGMLISASATSVTRALSSALLISAFALLFALPMLPIFFGESWLAPLTCALMIIGLPLIWVTASAANFEVEVEKHIKHDEAIRFSAPTIQVPTTPQAQPRATTAAPMDVSKPPPQMAIAPWTQTETLLLRASEGNAIAHRDVKRRLNARRTDAFGSEATSTEIALWIWMLMWFSVGVCGLIMGKLANVSAAENGLVQGRTFLVLIGALVLMTAMGFVALGAAPGFTRERSQKMLSALQMTALSPFDIVWGKVAGVLLLCAQYFGGALLALCVMTLFIGPLSALALGIFGVSSVVFTAMGSLTLSLWSRKTEIVALGALASIGALWWVIPMLYTNGDLSSFFRAPRWLEQLWLGPIRVILEPTSDWRLALALGHLALVCALATLLMGALCVRQLRRTRAEEEDASWLQRDLSRGWK